MWWITETKGDSKTGGHIYRHDLDIRNATGWHGVTAAAMEDCGAGSSTVAMPYKVVHGASDVAVGQRGYS